ncbi:cysteine--tRNA ligase, partial [candidate division KSB1 bacterium]
IPEESDKSANNDELIELLLAVRNELRDKKEFYLADKIRDDLYKLGFIIEDGADGTRWMKN